MVWGPDITQERAHVLHMEPPDVKASDLTTIKSPFLCPQKLYKTQILELKEDCEEKTKLYQDAQRRLEDLLEERCVCVCLSVYVL